MGDLYFDQTTFTQGQLDPRTQRRVDWDSYYKCAKELTNCLVIPQGGVQRRWGTKSVVQELRVPGSLLNYEISTIIYDDNSVYLLIWTGGVLTIILENTSQNVGGTGTPYLAEDIPNIRFTQVENRLIITHPNYPQAQLVRSANAANIITGVDVPNNGITITNNLVVGTVYPVTFTTAGTLPVTLPRIFINRTYFVKPYLVNAIKIYETPTDAANGVNAFTVTAAGAGVSNLIVQNTWTLSNITFLFQPTYDFNGGYAAITFTPSAVTGAVTLTASANIFTAAMIGGLFTGNGGTMRITGVTDATHATGYTVTSFANTNAILGALCFLGEPVWSVARGYPRTCGFIQNRLIFAGTESLPNGVWLSVVNQVYNFDDSEALADDAISWYPATGGINYINAMTAGRTLIMHSNTGNYSTPLSVEQPLTPTNFTLTEQNKFGVTPIQPIFIDNQIMLVDRSGNNVINMVWEITQSSFVTNNISVKASNLIVSPVDMAAFSQPTATDGFYALFVNSDGTLANYQTLVEEGIGAWSLMNTKTRSAIDQNNNYLESFDSFIRVTTALNRCWFAMNRTIYQRQAPVPITAFNAGNNSLTAVGSNIITGSYIAFSITGVGALPLTVPPLNSTQYFFGRRIDNDRFVVFRTLADSVNNVNALTVVNQGINANVIPVLEFNDSLSVEELTFDTYLDASIRFEDAAPFGAVTDLGHLEAKVVSVIADGIVQNNKTVFNGQITLDAPALEAKVGLPYTSRMVPLPLSIPQQYGILYKQKHIKTMYVSYYNTVGATIQDVDITTYTPGALAVPQSGTYVFTPRESWDGFEYDLVIEQTLPLPMTILALSYVVELS